MKFQLFVKRLTDLLVSFISIILLLPFMLIIAILIKTLMPGPIFFTQLRIGKNEKAFKILKFRTMKVDKAL